MLIKKAVLRGIIPFLIMTIISLIMKYQQIDAFQVKSTFLVGIIATSIGATSVIYEIEDWSLLKQSRIHFVLMLLTVFPCLLLSGWFELNVFMDYVKVFGIFVLVGLILWGILYLIFGKLLSK